MAGGDRGAGSWARLSGPERSHRWGADRWSQFMLKQGSSTPAGMTRPGSRPDCRGMRIGVVREQGPAGLLIEGAGPVLALGLGAEPLGQVVLARRGGR